VDVDEVADDDVEVVEYVEVVVVDWVVDVVAESNQ
jgi:hypothetical protein